MVITYFPYRLPVCNQFSFMAAKILLFWQICKSEGAFSQKQKKNLHMS